MITYAERVCFDSEHRKLLAFVEERVSRVSDEWGNELRCHELARAVHVVTYERGYKLVVVDGKCGPIEHSWLMLDGGRILDPYAPGRLPAVQLVDPIAGSYRPGEKRGDIRHAIVDQLVLEMRGDDPSTKPTRQPLIVRVPTLLNLVNDQLRDPDSSPSE